ITAKSGLPGRFGEWTTTYDIRNGTFEARHTSGNIISGNVRAMCTDQALVLEEFNTSNQNDGTCQLNRDGAKRFSGKCLPRGFDNKKTGLKKTVTRNGLQKKSAPPHSRPPAPPRLHKIQPVSPRFQGGQMPGRDGSSRAAIQPNMRRPNTLAIPVIS